jgi:PAS domain S-box-containing protein
MPIVVESEQIGSIRVFSNLFPVYRQMALSVASLLAAMLGGLVIAAALVARLHPVITRPIVDLVGLMERVSREKDYSLRAAYPGKDELGTLGSKFNDMLTQIRVRDEALAQHHAQLEKEVAQRTANLTEAQRIAHLGNWEWDIVGNRVNWSDEIYRIFGLAPQEFGATYEAFLGVVHPEDRRFVEAHIRDALELMRPYSIDHRVIKPDGSLRYVHEQGEVFRGWDGKPIMMRGTVQDITEAKLGEEQLRESEARYRGIFEHANDIIYLLETDGRFRSLSPAFEKITGWKIEEWIGMPFARLVHPDDLPLANEVFNKTLGGESMTTFRLRIARKSGDYFDADASITPLGRGAVTGAMGIARDVTERRQMEEKIRKLNEELELKVQQRTQQLLAAQEELVRKEKLAVLGQVAGSVGHELRNPLGVMNNAVYFLQTVLADADETVREYLGIIGKEIASSERIVSDLLDSVRTRLPRPEAVSVRELVEQTLGKLDIPSAVNVKLEIPESLPALWVDSLQIHQVLRNLISNGIEAMPEGGTLEIGAAGNDAAKSITISVRDTGVGMTQEQLGKLFQPLFTTKARGIGLGLVVVKNLTQANGGRIEVQSEAGEGTQFSVMLPMLDEKESEHA